VLKLRLIASVLVALLCLGLFYAVEQAAPPDRCGPDNPRCCKSGISRENTRAVLSRFGAPTSDGCLLHGVRGEKYRIVLDWGTPRDFVTVVLEPEACAMAPTIEGQQLSATMPPVFSEVCPQASAFLRDTLSTTTFGPMVPLRTFMADLGSERPLFGKWPLRAVVMLGFALLVLLLRRRWRAVDLGIAMSAGGVASLLIVVLPTQAAHACHDIIDLSWLQLALDVSGPGITPRSWVSLELWPLFAISGIDPTGWPWAILPVHLVNGALLGVLARQLGLSRSWSVVVGLVFVASPAIVQAFAPSTLLEVWLLTAYLAVCIAYLRRARASTPRAVWGWLAAEASAVWLGVGNKESFICYLGLLLVIEVAVILPASNSARRARGCAWRIGPHVLLVGAMLPFLLGPACRHGHTVSLELSSLLRQLTGLLGHAAFPDSFSDAAQGGVLVIFMLALCGVWSRGVVVWVGVAAALVVASPMLPLAERLLPPYIYQVWAFVALALVAGARAPRSRWRGVFLLWPLLLFVFPPQRLPPDPCMVDAGIVRELEQMSCIGPAPVWRVPQATWERWVAARERTPERRDGDEDPLVTPQQLVRLHCENIDARAVRGD